MTNTLMQTIALVEMSITCSVLVLLLLQAITRNTIPFTFKAMSVLILANLFFWPQAMQKDGIGDLRFLWLTVFGFLFGRP